MAPRNENRLYGSFLPASLYAPAASSAASKIADLCPSADLIPSSLSSSRAASSLLSPAAAAAAGAPRAAARFLVPAAVEKKPIAMHSKEYYAACTAGGVLSCGLTHMMVTPLDLVKCNMQVRRGLHTPTTLLFLHSFYASLSTHLLASSVTEEERTKHKG